MEHQTSVTVQLTNVKMVDEKTDEIINHEVVGKLTTNDAKNYSKELGYTFVSKDVTKDTFNIPTNSLIELKNNTPLNFQ